MSITDSKYYEVQSFDQLWLKVMLYILFFVGAGISLLITFNKNISFLAFLPLVTMTGVFIFFKSLKLSTTIDEKAIHYRFHPFHRRDRIIDKSNIVRAEVVRYKPISEFGGWGIRYNFKRGRAFSTRGNYGVQIQMANGKAILIGTQQPEKLKSFLEKYHYLIR